MEPAAEQRAIVDRDLQEEHGHRLKCDIRYFKLWFGLKLANNTSKTTQAYSPVQFHESCVSIMLL